jgi:DNA-binding MarR family transcriptional regulator
MARMNASDTTAAPHGFALPGAPESIEALSWGVERFIFQIVRQRGLAGSPEINMLTPTQTLALADVADHGPLRLGSLAQLMGTTDATATRTVDSLEALGLVERVRDPDDGRAVQIDVTPTGRRSACGRRARLAQALHAGLAGVSEEDRQRFIALFAELDNLIGPLHHRSCLEAERSDQAVGAAPSL